MGLEFDLSRALRIGDLNDKFPMRVHDVPRLDHTLHFDTFGEILIRCGMMRCRGHPDRNDEGDGEGYR
jgi:hypothetical protein